MAKACTRQVTLPHVGRTSPKGNLRSRFTAITLGCLLCLVSVTSGAQMNLDFRPNTSNTSSSNSSSDGFIDERQLESCGIAGYANTDCEWDSKGQMNGTGGDWLQVDPTPFRQETILGADGYEYWHVLIGNHDDNFRQDVYMRKGLRWGYMSGDVEKSFNWDGQSTQDQGSFTDSGGFAGGLQGNGEMDGDWSDRMNCFSYAGNACDPLLKNSDANGGNLDNRWAGNGTGNPTKVIMHQVVKKSDSQGDFYLEFLKDGINTKPRIIQTVSTTGVIQGDIYLEFQVDMRDITYNDDATVLAVGDSLPTRAGGTSDEYARNDPNARGKFVNKNTFTGGGIGFDVAAFNLEEQGDNVQVTAGRYKFIPGSGWVQSGTTYESAYGLNIDGNAIVFYDAGSYTYVDGIGRDPMDIDYNDYVDGTQTVMWNKDTGKWVNCHGGPFCEPLAVQPPPPSDGKWDSDEWKD